MTPCRVVEAFDVVEPASLRLRPRSIDLLPDPLGLERGAEAFHGGIIPDIAGPAHRAGDAIVGHQSLDCSPVDWLPWSV